MPSFAASLPSGYKGKVLWHYMAPWQVGIKSDHRDVGYNADDQRIIDRDLDLILKVCEGLPPDRVGVIPDWYGPNHTKEPWIDRACLKLRDGCERRGMPLSMCADGGITGGTAGMQIAFKYLAEKYFPSPSFLKDSTGRVTMIEFTAAVNWSTVLSPYPALRLLHWKNDAKNGYAWIRPKPDEPDPLGRLVSDNQEVAMPCVCPGFDDHQVSKPQFSAWGGYARFADYMHGQFWLKSLASIPVASEFFMVATWNDFDERSDVIGAAAPSLFTGALSDLAIPTGDAIQDVTASVPEIKRRVEVWAEPNKKLWEQSITVPDGVKEITVQVVDQNNTVLSKMTLEV